KQAVIYTGPACKRLSAQWEAEHTEPAPRTPDLRNAVVYVDGEVLVPSRFSWSNGWTLADAISAAGGFTEHAKVSSVTIRHDTSANSSCAKRSMAVETKRL